jgi:hypothetical protein
MPERGIIMSGELVRAILDGRKTQTRRVVKPQPHLCHGGHLSWASPRGRKLGSEPAGTLTLDEFAPRCPYPVGSRLWVRETWCPVDDSELGGAKWIAYRATPKYGADEPGGWGPDTKSDPDRLTWRSPIYMPRSASRLTRLVEDVRVERVQEITEEDAIAEGWEKRPDVSTDPEVHRDAARDWFMDAWEKINGKRAPWASNPWVFVVRFRVDDAGRAAMERE